MILFGQLIGRATRFIFMRRLLLPTLAFMCYFTACGLMYPEKWRQTVSEADRQPSRLAWGYRYSEHFDSAGYVTFAQGVHFQKRCLPGIDSLFENYDSVHTLIFDGAGTILFDSKNPQENWFCPGDTTSRIEAGWYWHIIKSYYRGEVDTISSEFVIHRFKLPAKNESH